MELVTVERKDNDRLERLKAERQEKINELKERTNYYITQQLIQVIAFLKHTAGGEPYF